MTTFPVQPVGHPQLSIVARLTLASWHELAWPSVILAIPAGFLLSVLVR